MEVEVGGVKVRFISWPEAIGLSEELGRRVLDSGYKPEIILAVSRGGLVPARIISDVLDVDNIVAMAVKYWAVAERRAERPIIYHGVEPSVVGGKRVLVVDEVADTGATLKLIADLLNVMGAAEVKSAVLHVKSTSKFAPEYYAERITEWVWISYPWSRWEDYREFKRRGYDISKYIDKIC
ncbi:MAG: phosphoribosyltransferase [Thermoproteus sp.]|nr:phosphoribosyltransferase [Thermoproteus sp.]